MNRASTLPPRYRMSIGPLALTACLLLLPLLLAHSAAPIPGPAPIPFGIGLTPAVFRNVNLKDATAAYRSFVDADGRRLGYATKSETLVFEDTATYQEAIQRGSMKMMVMDAWQFLSMNLRPFAKPYFSIMEHGKVGRKYLLLTRRDSGLQTVADLRGKKLLQSEAARSNVGMAWLATLLLGQRLGAPETFFTKLEVVAKPTEVVLPVFFGKAPACFVDEPCLDLMVELNPQVGRALQVVAASENFANVVICLSETNWPVEQHKLDIIASLRNVHRTPSGQQILTLFKINQLVPFQENQLETLKQLMATNERLKKEIKP